MFVNVCANPVAFATPPTNGTGADVANGGGLHVPFVKNSNVTDPVGTGPPTVPVTVAWSCTVAPASTVVTTLPFASNTSVADSRCSPSTSRYTCPAKSTPHRRATDSPT